MNPEALYGKHTAYALLMRYDTAVYELHKDAAQVQVLVDPIKTHCECLLFGLNPFGDGSKQFVVKQIFTCFE
ncbi:hypothetical protein DV872_23865 [Oceanispirochaeta sp. M1]|nr:hypothetical protein DV872_23865 [Oceanispirochaeta sp. M1]